MSEKDNGITTQVSFRLPRRLVQRMKNVSEANVWPPPPTQTALVIQGLETVLRQLEKQRGRARAGR